MTGNVHSVGHAGCENVYITVNNDYFAINRLKFECYMNEICTSEFDEQKQISREPL